MERDMDFHVGERVTYFPNQKADENLHPLVEVVSKRIKVRIVGGEPLGKVVWVARKRLARCAELPGVA